MLRRFAEFEIAGGSLPLRRTPLWKKVKTRTRANYVDELIGQRVRLRRCSLGMSQTALGAGLGVTFQQVQKYERGTNRIAAEDLYKLARLLRAPISYFFDDLQRSSDVLMHADLRKIAFSEEGSQLIVRFSKIREPRVRSCLIALLKQMAVAP